MARKYTKKDKQNQWEAAIRLAVEGRTWADVAKKMGVDSNTVWHWRQDDKFKERLAKMQDAILAETASKHALYLGAGFKRLYDQAINKEGKYCPEIEQKAAQLLIEYTHRNIDILMPKRGGNRPLAPVEIKFHGISASHEEQPQEPLE